MVPKEPTSVRMKCLGALTDLVGGLSPTASAAFSLWHTRSELPAATFTNAALDLSRSGAVQVVEQGFGCYFARLGGV